MEGQSATLKDHLAEAEALGALVDLEVSGTILFLMGRVEIWVACLQQLGVETLLVPQGGMLDRVGIPRKRRKTKQNRTEQESKQEKPKQTNTHESKALSSFAFKVNSPLSPKPLILQAALHTEWFLEIVDVTSYVFRALRGSNRAGRLRWRGLYT